MRKILLAVVLTAILTSCSTTSEVTRSQRYGLMYEEKPVAILVMPPINRSTKVEAKELFYSSLVVPLTQRGYYVMPPLLTMEILKQESAYDAEMFLNSSMKRVGELFGVDAVLFTTIHRWDKATVASQIRVVVEYTLKSAKTDQILFSRKGEIVYNPNSGQGGLIGLAASMISTALTKEISVGRQCNNLTLRDMPAGRYSPSWGADGNSAAGEENFSAILR